MNLRKSIPLFVLALAMSHCADRKFRAPVPIDEIPRPPIYEKKLMDLSCEDSATQTVEFSSSDGADYKVQDNANVDVAIKGRFCLPELESLTVLFVIDFSGSMGPSASSNVQPAAGHDPRAMYGTSKSCARLQAVETIVSKVKDRANVSIGTIAFASNIVESHSQAPMDVKKFAEAKLAEDSKLNNFCSYIAPGASFANQEMAVPGAKVGSGTNYAAAFNRAHDALKNIKGRKALYFITDGRPTEPNDPVGTSKIAMNRLKTIEGLAINAFFLQNTQSGLAEDKEGFDNLVQTVGTDSRVLRVDSAAQLAQELAKDQFNSFDAAKIQASIVVESQEEKPLKIVSFTQDSAPDKAWVFETESFTLHGEGSKAFPHQVKVKASTQDGKEHSSQINITYQKKR